MKKGKKPILDWKAIQAYYDDKHTIAECRLYFKRPFLNFHRGKRLGLFKGRTLSETWKISKRFGRKISDKQKQLLSKSLKQRHKEGTAHTFAHIKRQPSWPEIWFKRVIEQEFSDKNYVAEYHLGRYSLDFAWVDKKKVIEMDGEQHYLQPYQIESDKRKDNFLKEQGWEVFRLRWRLIYKDPTPHIIKANAFIGFS